MPITIPLRALLPYALGALEYLLRPLLEPAPQTGGVTPPYTPPFRGGQCVGVRYYINFTAYQARVDRTSVVANELQFSAFGNISSVTFDFLNGSPTCFFVGKNSTGATFNGRVAIPSLFSNELFTISGLSLVRADGSLTECGDVGSPDPPLPVPNSGLANSGSPNLDNLPVVQAGFPLAGLLPFLSLLNNALDAAKNANDALQAIKSVADAIKSIADLLKKLADNADKDEEEKDEANKEITRLDIGSVVKDGYLRLYPSNPQKKRAIYLDLQLLSIPVYYGKYFGQKSPNFYRFKSLGYISFTSPTFGIMETKEIEFSRMSLTVPDNATGFFYHLGLQGDIFANVSVFYQEQKE